MVLPVVISSMAEIPVARIPEVADLFIGIPAQLPREGAVAGNNPGGTIVWGLIPDVMIEAIVSVAHKEDVLGDSDSHMEAQFRRLDKKGWLLVVDRRLLVYGRGRGRNRNRNDGCRPGADIDSDVKIDVGSKGVGYGESGDKRQTIQNSFHLTVPSLV